MEDGKDIELRSEAVQEVMGHVPSWIVRWGITVLSLVVLMLVVGSFFFRYPDVIEAEMRLTSRNPVTEVVARTSGRVSSLYVADGQEVKEGLPLAVVENTALTEDVLRLKQLLARYAGEPERLGYYLLQDVWQLGDIQPAYTALASKDPASRDYRAALGQLLAAVRRWEMDYCIEASASGRVQLLRQGYPNLYVQGGDLFARIVPEDPGEWIGLASMPVASSGKVRKGQRVIVRFSNFPDQEFGIVEGRVSSVSMVPLEDNYRVEIAFPGGLTTNYGICLPVMQEMKATAGIVTEELRLIERLFQPLKKILREGM